MGIIPNIGYDNRNDNHNDSGSSVELLEVVTIIVIDNEEITK